MKPLLIALSISLLCGCADMRVGLAGADYANDGATAPMLRPPFSGEAPGSLNFFHAIDD